MNNTPIRVAICADFPEEGWPSMDRVAGDLIGRVNGPSSDVTAIPVCPPFRRRASRLSGGRMYWNIDRGLNRFVDYPRRVRSLRDQYDVFHVVDHSYAQLVHHLPASRTIVTCHDLDAFRAVLRPADEPRSFWFKQMTHHLLAGLRRAAYVTCDTAAIRDELVSEQLVAAERTLVIPLGVSDAFSDESDADSWREAERLIAARPGAVVVLHVGSTSARKRIDVVLRCCAALRRELPELQLVRVGGAFTSAQEQLVRDLGLDEHVSVLAPLTDRMLAAVYRRADVLMFPSEREGFGLPLAEALRCGTPVVASDIPVLREVGGNAAEYCAGSDPDAWARLIVQVTRDRTERPERWAGRRAAGLARAKSFTWARFAERLSELYVDVARGHAAPAARRRPVLHMGEDPGPGALAPGVGPRRR